MALSGLQITRNAPGGGGRAYAGFAAKAETALPAEAATGAGGGGRKGRYHYIEIDGRIIFVNSHAEAQRLLRQAKQAKKDVRREQKEEKRRIIKLKKKPEDGDVAWNKAQEKELQALLKQMYDDEEAIVALLCLH